MHTYIVRGVIKTQRQRWTQVACYILRERQRLKYYIRERLWERERERKKIKRKRKVSDWDWVSLEFSSGRVLASVHCNCTHYVYVILSSTTHYKVQLQTCCITSSIYSHDPRERQQPSRQSPSRQKFWFTTLTKWKCSWIKIIWWNYVIFEGRGRVNNK